MVCRFCAAHRKRGVVPVDHHSRAVADEEDVDARLVNLHDPQRPRVGSGAS